MVCLHLNVRVIGAGGVDAFHEAATGLEWTGVLTEHVSCVGCVVEGVVSERQLKERYWDSRIGERIPVLIENNPVCPRR